MNDNPYSQQNNPFQQAGYWQPNPSPPAQKSRKKLILYIVGGIVLAIGIVIAGIIIFMHSRESTAVDACHDAVSKSAKYPGSVEFITTDVETLEEDGFVFVVSGYTDFENGFGAPVRHTYFCTAELGFTGDAEIRPDSVIVMEGRWLDN